MKHLLLLLLVFVLNACDHDNEKATIVTSFPQTGKLQAQVTQLPVPVLLPRYMGIVGEKLVVIKKRKKNFSPFLIFLIVLILEIWEIEDKVLMISIY